MIFSLRGRPCPRKLSTMTLGTAALGCPVERQLDVRLPRSPNTPRPKRKAVVYSNIPISGYTLIVKETNARSRNHSSNNCLVQRHRLALRSILAPKASRKRALSKFVEDAVKWRLFDQTVNQAREAFADLPRRTTRYHRRSHQECPRTETPHRSNPFAKVTDAFGARLQRASQRSAVFLLTASATLRSLAQPCIRPHHFGRADQRNLARDAVSENSRPTRSRASRTARQPASRPGHRHQKLPKISRSPDPDDNHLLALAEAGQAQFLVTGDKRVLSLKRHKSTRIITPAALIHLLK